GRRCERVLAATMSTRGGTVVIEKDCPDHGEMIEDLNDAIFTDQVSDRPGSPHTTFSGHRINPVVRFLPKTVETLCPECGRNIVGRVFDWQGDVYMEKTCPDHGYVKDRVTTNTELFLKCQQWSFREGAGLSNPNVKDASHCPSECGLCNQHQSHTLLGQIDLTNRCNLACPICFANANVQGFVFEPEFDEIVRQLERLRAYRPVPASAVQFTGGEPTIYPRFFDAVRRAKDLGFSHIQIASNGITLADEDFAMNCAEAGLHTVYLQFDGVDDNVYEFTRGRKLIDIKKQALENIHKAGMKACLVPTIVRGINDDQVPKILQFALDNIHVVSAIAYQPVAFTGRISTEEREAQRYTLGDLANQLEETGLIEAMRDVYPLSVVAPLSRLMAALTGDPKITATAHPTCSSGTYFVVDKNKNAVPVTKLFDIGGLFTEMDDLAEKIENGRFKWWYKMKVPMLFKKYYKPESAPEGMNVKAFMHALRGMTNKKTGRGKSGETTYRTLMAAAMHFQDRYNYDVERVRRCVIHYSTPEGMFPFCAYNSGPIHRERVEAKHSVTLAEWRERKKMAAKGAAETAN
ncbi:MAG: radical SAM protein, partial [Candidatus Latescibacterota bacterium]